VSRDDGLRITELALAAYELPLRRPWISARGRIGTRRGWLVRIASSDGQTGWGDCAPLQAAGTESEAEARRRLVEGLKGLGGMGVAEALAVLDGWGDSPAARCGVECALLDLLARTAGLPLARWLRAEAPAWVPVNAALGGVDADLPARLRDALAAGFQVLKVKLGESAGALDAVDSLASELPPHARLRLDANGAWEPSRAEVFLERLCRLPVESLEEPLAWPEPETLRALQSRVPWPLALDESLARWPLERWLVDPPVRRLVLKPMVLGGLLPALRLAEAARAVGLESVVTTTVDSAAGVRAALHLAAAVGGSVTHGLATSGWLQDDLGVPPPVQDGAMSLGEGNGLGFVPSTRLFLEALG
jgi:o-succinylbenzoate synthase